MSVLTPDMLIEAYSTGVFPMADWRRATDVRWYSPDPRAILPLDSFHVPKNVGKLVRSGRFDVTTDRDFPAVMLGCADRRSTWISDLIINAYAALHERGLAHSVECWKEGALVGGLYGVSLGGAFFGESMFSRERDASKVALVHLVERLKAGGYVLLDIQMTTPLTLQFGAIEIPRIDYLRRLEAALRVHASWESGVAP